MRTLFSLAALSLLLSVVLGQHNITVNDTDPSIQYQGGAGDAPICQVSSNGTIVTSQPGCYNIPSKCTASVAMGQRQESAATFTFQGSAIYINSLMFNLSPLYTVTLDGNATDVDGFRSSSLFLCETLFSRTGLDPTINHTINLAIKSQSPSATPSPGAASNDIFDFSLINFIYTVEDAINASSTSTTASTASMTPTSSILSSTSSTASSNSAALANTTKSSSGISMQTAVSRLHTMGLGAVLVLASVLLSGAHFA